MGHGQELRRRRAPFISPRQVHGRLKIVRVAQLDVDPDMVRETADEQVRFLVWQKVVGVADEFVEAFLVLLDRAPEGKNGRLVRTAGPNR
jgi:hypothetical protein